MDISPNLASKNYQNMFQAVQPSGQPGAGGGTKDDGPSFAQIAQNLIQTMQQGEATVADGLVGKADAHSVVQALAQTELAVDTAISIRDKVVEAYQEILRMPV